MKFAGRQLADSLTRKQWRFRSATDAIVLPNLKPRAIRIPLVVPAIGGGDVTGAEWSNVRRLEHFLQLLDVVNDAFNVHPSQYPT
jgi:hypothetical protein